MRWIVLRIIKFYWFSFPETKRRHCLFKETCSVHVHRLIKEKGLTAGFLAFISRVKKCRNGYSIYLNDNEFEMSLADGTTICKDEISPKLLDEISFLAHDYMSKEIK